MQGGTEKVSVESVGMELVAHLSVYAEFCPARPCCEATGTS